MSQCKFCHVRVWPGSLCRQGCCGLRQSDASRNTFNLICIFKPEICACCIGISDEDVESAFAEEDTVCRNDTRSAVAV